jgi:hypothetical protein
MNNVDDRVSKNEYLALRKAFVRHKIKIEEIKNSSLCFGDKARKLIKDGVTDNMVYARRLLEMK